MGPKRTLSRFMLAAAVALAAAAAMLWAADGQAQCALCRTAVEGAGRSAARAMNLGILVLLVPPVAIFCAIFAIAYKKGKGSSE